MTSAVIILIMFMLISMGISPYTVVKHCKYQTVVAMPPQIDMAITSLILTCLCVCYLSLGAPKAQATQEKTKQQGQLI